MKRVVLDQIPFRVDRNLLFKRIHLQPDDEDGARVMEMIKEAEEIGRPKVVYTLSSINDKQDDHVIIDNVRLSSRIMRVNFADINRVFPYVATCGRELHEWAEGIEDMLEQYWAAVIMEQAHTAAQKYFYEHLENEYRLGKFRSMHPGSLEDWPISQQRELFQILGDVRKSVGVELTESCLMLPIKSTSGILFQTESDFVSCRLCPREGCPNRRAEYRPGLYAEKYQAAGN